MPGAGDGSTYANHMYDVNLVELFIKPSYMATEAVSNWGNRQFILPVLPRGNTQSLI